MERMMSDYVTKNTLAGESREFAETKPVNSKLYKFSDLKNIPDLVCFSHLRWDFVFQRPQHLLTRFGKKVRVFFVEEPIYDAHVESNYLAVSEREDNLTVVTPHLIPGRPVEENYAAQQKLIARFLQEKKIEHFIAWYYTPMALNFTRDLKPAFTVFDCMDELSAFAGAPPELREAEKELFKKADIVFTGGQSLYESKKNHHADVHAFPSSIEKAHFAQARNQVQDPIDQAAIPGPRLGFFGVIDERMDIGLLGEVARLRPEWQIVMLGPVVKIDPATLPKEANIHYLGMKSYKELPAYISGWDVALLPFAMNESTKFISPTKTPEYLAAGRPVVSTPIRDVVSPYGDKGLVHIADTPAGFVKAIEAALAQKNDADWLESADRFLSLNSWDNTWDNMTHLICNQLLQREGR